MEKIVNDNILFLLADNRNCKSNNMQRFFRGRTGKRMANQLEVIRFEGALWFVTLGWLVRIGNETGFAGVRVVEVACQGVKATTGYPDWQKGNDYEIVTDWFWGKYRERGMVSIPEIWHIEVPKELTHRELHTI